MTQDGWIPTRDAALERLEAFLPDAGVRYARTRNTDEGWSGDEPTGPARRSHVSGLSPWLTRRMLTEREVVAAAVGRHGSDASRKFVEEILWRTYWKGWLARHPSVWDDYEQARKNDAQRVSLHPGRRRVLAQATAGTTGIECFDHWVRELSHTGYLHNHARMWFASIWVFTLGLPWSLGAALFERELLDRDPASNTLSWRWVAGLHTRGKPYVARAANIAKYTGGRFDPRGQLDEHPSPLREDVEHPLEPPPLWPPVEAGPRTGLLVTTEDLAVERSELARLSIAAIAGGRPVEHSDPERESARMRAFDTYALDDGLRRAGRHFVVAPSRLPDGPAWLAAVVQWARAHALERVVAMAPAVGPWESPFERLRTALLAHGIELALTQREWDRLLFPYTDRGYFKLRRQIPRVTALGPEPVHDPGPAPSRIASTGG
ncbi:MAG: FAD-binding domain-containing protein [Myxococcota bacterium]